MPCEMLAFPSFPIFSASVYQTRSLGKSIMEAGPGGIQEGSYLTVTARDSALQCSSEQCSAMQCSTIQLRAVQCKAVQCSALQFRHI